MLGALYSFFTIPQAEAELAIAILQAELSRITLNVYLKEKQESI